MFVKFKIKGIAIRVVSLKFVMEEAFELYKDVIEVVNMCYDVGIFKKCVKLCFIVVVKG